MSNEASAHRGGEVLLRILGGLLIGYVVSAHSEFIDYMRKGATVQDASNNLVTPSNLILYLAYFSYIVNVFRQIQGMAIVVTDDRYYNQVGRYLSWKRQALNQVGFIAVLGIPYYLVAHIKYTVNNCIQPNMLFLLIIYLSTAAAYILWDFVSFSKCCDGRRAQFFCFPEKNASAYRHWIPNWIILNLYAIIVGIIFFIVCFGLSRVKIDLVTKDGLISLLEPKKLEDIMSVNMPALFLGLTLGYSLLDYLYNRLFYYPQDKSVYLVQLYFKYNLR